MTKVPFLTLILASMSYFFLSRKSPNKSEQALDKLFGVALLIAAIANLIIDIFS